MNITTESGETPETVTINGVEYRRYGDSVDRQIARIRECQRIAQQTGITLQQAVYFANPNAPEMPI